MASLPDPYFLSFEALVYVLFGLCAAHAWRKGLGKLWQLVAAALFGLLLEWATIQQLQAYQYGRFMLMLGEVPVCVGVGWGAVIYAAREYSDGTSLPEWARPALDALLALNVDLAMDVVAIRLGFWNWAIGIDEQYFGVPWANFWAWFWVVFSFSAGLRLLLRWRHAAADALAPLGAIALGVVCVLVTNQALELVRGHPAYPVTVGVVIVAALALLAFLQPRLDARPKPSLAAWVPGGMHAYFLVAGLVSGAILRPPFLLGAGVAMVTAAALVHWKGRSASAAAASA